MSDFIECFCLFSDTSQPLDFVNSNLSVFPFVIIGKQEKLREYFYLSAIKQNFILLSNPSNILGGMNFQKWKLFLAQSE